MGRGKVEMKRIADRHSRHVAFSKRRIGLMKKASEISVLCDVEIALIVFSGSGNLYDFSSPHSMEKTLERYRTYNEDAADKDADKPKSPTDHTSGLGTGGEPLELMSNLKVEHLTMKELTRVERKLDAILRQTRQKKTQLMMQTLTRFAEEERRLREEKRVLEEQIGAMIDRQTGHVHNRQNDERRGKQLRPIWPNDQGEGGNAVQLF